jgi:hypothetical protein
VFNLIVAGVATGLDGWLNTRIIEIVFVLALVVPNVAVLVRACTTPTAVDGWR